MRKKPKLVVENKQSDRPEPGTPEFELWLDKRAKAAADFYFDENREVPELDADTRFLVGSWDFLYQSDEEIDAENEAMERADEERRRAKFKVIK